MATGREARDLLPRFSLEAERAGSEVMVLDDWAGVAAHVDGRAGGGRVVLAPSLAGRAPGLVEALTAASVGFEVADDDEAAVPGGVADAAVGVVGGELAVAETGGVMVSEHALADRAVSMLTRRLVLVVERGALVDSLDDVAEWLTARPGGAGFVSLMTGPSRTADIERSLTIGVQGPDAMDVVVLG